MYDIIIIGGGAAGMSAALYASRGGMDTLVLEKLSPGGQAALTYEIDNYPGFYEAPSGTEVSQALERHAKKFGAQFKSEAVKSIELGKPIVLKTRRNEYQTKALILATGATPRPLGVEGEEEFKGMGVSYCATCDGGFFKDKVTAVVGGGNTAFEDAVYLSRLCKKVYLIHRRKGFRAVPSLIEQAQASAKIEIITDTILEKISGSQTVQEISIKNVLTQETSTLAVDGVFAAVGIVPESALAGTVVALDDYGFIKTDASMRTNQPGVFAAGDVRTTPLRQVITAAADGAVAASAASAYVNEAYGDAAL